MRRTNGASRFDTGAPDVTDDVMRRLGFELIDPTEGRRISMRRHLLRALGASVLLTVVLMGGLYERADRVRSSSGALPAAIERSVGARAQIFQGLLAPIERLKQALDRVDSSRTNGYGTTYEPASRAQGAGPSAPALPTYDEKALAPFPTS